MSKKEMLDLMRLLSALESWAMSRSERLPSYLHEQIANSTETLEGYILESNPYEGLYQDAEGTIPVTAVGQPVGLVVDPFSNVFVQHDPEHRPHAVKFGRPAEEDKP